MTQRGQFRMAFDTLGCRACAHVWNRLVAHLEPSRTPVLVSKYQPNSIWQSARDRGPKLRSASELLTETFQCQVAPLTRVSQHG